MNMENSRCTLGFFYQCTLEWPLAAIFRYARWLEELEPSLLATVILFETGEDYRERDLLDKVSRLIEILGLEGAALIVGCP
jgi:hypothetical protein